MTLVLLLLALLGHAFIWVALINRTHSGRLSHGLSRCITVVCFLILAVVPVWFGWWLVSAGFGSGEFGSGGLGRIWQHGSLAQWRQLPAGWLAYLIVCWSSAPLTTGWWVWRTMFRRTPGVLRLHRRRSVTLAGNLTRDDSKEHLHHYLVHLPGNEILKLDRTDRDVDVPRMAPALDGLSIVHLSDFHFTGRVGKAYFREVVRLCNQTEPDMVAITGDLIDSSDLIDWMPDTLGSMESRYGVYFVLGNHDVRFNPQRLRRTLVDHGLVDLGGRWVEIEVSGEPVILAGNELPWIAPAPDMSGCPPRTPGGGPLRIVLSHSPDQLAWAQDHDADLFLAGHTHGGQICFPLIGPIFSPSRSGVRYTEGIFHAPPTIMHVTRGISAEIPIRFNCPPEMSHLVLRAMRK